MQFASAVAVTRSRGTARLAAGLAVAGLLVGAPAWAQDDDDPNNGWITSEEVEARDRARSPFAGSRLGIEMQEPVGTSRLQIVARGIFSDGQSVFADQAAWALEAPFHLALSENFGFRGVLPMGIVNPGLAETRAFPGNFAIGVAGGGAIDLVDPVQSETPIRLRIGGGLDGYLPIYSSDNQVTRDAQALVAALRAYEPQLYVPDLLAFRLRGQAILSAGDLTAQVELSLVPGTIVRRRAKGMFMIGAAARISYTATKVLEPFIEMGATTQVAGDGQIKPPFMITPGIRLHTSPYFSPAIFASMNFVTSPALIIGIDLAMAMPKADVKTKRTRADDPEDFLNGGF